MTNRFIRFNIIIISFYIFYVLIVTSISQVLFPTESNGSLLKQDSIVIGSLLLGQQFESPNYFKSRISFSHSNTYKKSTFSDEINSSPASNLDPFISKSNAFSQINRIASTRKVNPTRVKSLVDKYSKENIYSKKSLLNTVELNLALDKYFGG